jgi:hypothetical protein
MKPVILEDQGQEAEPLDEATQVAVEIGRVQLRRGEGIPLEQVKSNVRDRIQAWRKTQEEALTA